MGANRFIPSKSWVGIVLTLSLLLSLVCRSGHGQDQALARVPGGACVAQIFAYSYEPRPLNGSSDDLGCYVPRMCAQNVHDLVRRLAKAQMQPNSPIRMDRLSVVYIKDDFTPLSPRPLPQDYSGLVASSEEGWGWHVIAVYEGLVLDLDYSAAAGRPVSQAVPVRSWVSRQMGELHWTRQGSGERLADVPVRVIDGNLFLQLYDKPMAVAGMRRIVKVDSDFLMRADLGDGAKDMTLLEWVRQHSVVSQPGAFSR